MSFFDEIKLPRMFVAAMAPVLLAISGTGCTIMPGLHVSEGPQLNGYEAKPEADGNGVLVTDKSSGFSYRLVDISAKNIASLVQQQAQVQLPTQLGSVTPGAVPDEYVLGPGDILSVIVWEHPELTNATGNLSDPISSGRLISNTGMLFYPYVGEFKIAGMTVAQARAYLTKGLSVVIKSPQVDLRVVSYRSKRVEVTGAVNSPGSVTLDDTAKGVLDAISERGGISSIASRRRVELIRGGKTFELDINQLVSGHSPILNPPLKPGDIINIPDQSSDQVFVLGSVGEQGAVYLQQTGSTLTEALAQAKGLDSLRADDSGVLIFRHGEPGTKEPVVFALDMSTPVGLLLAGEFPLQARDVIYVKATDFAKYNAVISQLLPTITAVYQLDRL